MKGTDVWLYEHAFDLSDGGTVPTQRANPHGLALVLSDQQDPSGPAERSERRRDLLGRRRRILNAIFLAELGVCPGQILGKQLRDGFVVGARDCLAQFKL